MVNALFFSPIAQSPATHFSLAPTPSIGLREPAIVRLASMAPGTYAKNTPMARFPSRSRRSRAHKSRYGPQSSAIVPLT